MSIGNKLKMLEIRWIPQCLETGVHGDSAAGTAAEVDGTAAEVDPPPAHLISPSGPLGDSSVPIAKLPNHRHVSTCV